MLTLRALSTRLDGDNETSEKPPANGESESMAAPLKRAKIVTTRYRDNGDGSRSRAGAFTKKKERLKVHLASAALFVRAMQRRACSPRSMSKMDRSSTVPPPPPCLRTGAKLRILINTEISRPLVSIPIGCVG